MAELTPRSLRLGTRRSLLALAQARLVATSLESLHSGLRVELVGLDTRGDRELDRPLHDLGGKELFVGELDRALLAGQVDANVHSHKDLSTDRPEALVTAAIPERADPRDVVVFAPSAEARLRAGLSLRLGSSAPRRQQNVPSFLQRALPSFGHPPSVEMVSIRGNVDSRLARLQSGPDESRQVDGVVLALAGLARLWDDASGRARLESLLAGVRWMVLPLRECPAAPGQGALAVECRANDEATKALLFPLDHASTRRHVQAERSTLTEAGGGCHQRFGVTSITHDRLGDLRFTHGVDLLGRPLSSLDWHPPPKPDAPDRTIVAWDGSRAIQGESRPIPHTWPDLSERPVFVAHHRAVSEASRLAGAHVWVAGTKTWFTLAARGVWVEGSVEGLGFDSQLRHRPSVLGGSDSWLVVTHADATPLAPGVEQLATYRAGAWLPDPTLDRATHAYWTSPTQAALSRGRSLVQACGPGRTAEVLRSQGIDPLVFPSIEEWRRWLTS